MPEDKIPPEEVRLDRWLMAARFYKTRSQAAQACQGGKVKVNGISAKPHKLIRVGDRLLIHHHGRYREIEVLGLAEKGLPPAVAKTLYKEETKKPLSTELEEQIQWFFRSIQPAPRKFKGRPTKKERRQMEKFFREMGKWKDAR